MLGPLTFEVVFQKVDKSALNFKKLFVKISYRNSQVFKAKIGNFEINLEVKGGPGPCSRCQIIIKIGLKLNFFMVSNGPRPPQIWPH